MSDVLPFERMLLGLLMRGGHAQIAKVADQLDPQHFAIEAHAAVYATLVDAMRRNLPTNAAVITSMAERAGRDTSAIAECLDVFDRDAVPVRDPVILFERVIRAHELRARTVAAKALAEACEADDRDGQARAMAALAQAEARNPRIMPWRSVVETALQRVHEARDRVDEGMTTALPLGFPQLEAWSPVGPRTLTILAARPSSGKSALVGQMIRNVAASGVGVGLFSLEMNGDEWASRLFASGGYGVPPVQARRIYGGRVDSQDIDRIAETADQLYDLPILVNDRPGLSLSTIEFQAQAMRYRLPNLGLLVVDHVGLVEKERGETRNDVLERCAKRFKGFAKQHDIAVLLLSQLNRGIEQRGRSKNADRASKVPNAADLYGSDMLAQMPDNVWLLHQPSHYADSEPEDVAQLLIAKSRNGQRDRIVQLRWDAPHIRFEEDV